MFFENDENICKHHNTKKPDLMCLQSPPGYLLVENVVGFQESMTHEIMEETLSSLGYDMQVSTYVFSEKAGCKNVTPPNCTACETRSFSRAHCLYDFWPFLHKFGF